jgi:hypothetical protein
MELPRPARAFPSIPATNDFFSAPGQRLRESRVFDGCGTLPHEDHALFDELQRTFPGLDYRQPEGDGQLRSSYFHIAVCMLEWQAMEELTDTSRARSVIECKQRDHYKAVYAILLQRRDSVEAVLHRHGVKW